MSLFPAFKGLTWGPAGVCASPCACQGQPRCQPLPLCVRRPQIHVRALARWAREERASLRPGRGGSGSPRGPDLLCLAGWPGGGVSFTGASRPRPSHSAVATMSSSRPWPSTGEPPRVDRASSGLVASTGAVMTTPPSAVAVMLAAGGPPRGDRAGQLPAPRPTGGEPPRVHRAGQPAPADAQREFDDNRGVAPPGLPRVHRAGLQPALPARSAVQAMLAEPAGSIQPTPDDRLRVRSRSPRRPMRADAVDRRPRSRGSLPELSLASARASALADYHADVYSATSRASLGFKLRTVTQMFAAWGVELTPRPQRRFTSSVPL